MDARSLAEAVTAAGRAEDAIAKTRFFKAGPGGYAEGDVFCGTDVPTVRRIAKQAGDAASLDVIAELLGSPVHEVRLLAAVILSDRGRARRTTAEVREEVARLVLTHAESFDNWDLVDTVAPHAVGPWLTTLPREEQERVLDPLVRDPSLWRRRIAMVSMFGPLRSGDVDLPLAVAERLLDAPEDLMHKAVGWLLREAGLRDRLALDAFLAEHAGTMPRTTLRYAIEKHSPEERRYWLGRRAA